MSDPGTLPAKETHAGETLRSPQFPLNLYLGLRPTLEHNHFTSICSYQEGKASHKAFPFVCLEFPLAKNVSHVNS